MHARLGPTGRRTVRAVVDAPLAPVVGSVRSSRCEDRVALTLDDGPDDAVTPALLELLAARGVRASFFVLALRAQRRPDLVRRMLDDGHEVALHGDDHRRVSTMSYPEARSYLDTARDRLEQVTGSPVRRFRPPYGSQSVRSYVAARVAGLQVCVWSADAQDWVDRSGEEVSRDAVSAVSPGGILLLHERLEPDPLRGSPTTSFDRVRMVEGVLDGLVGRGLSATSVSGLEEEARLVRSAWFRP
ncbi:peptidoglycan/xylan/chitin deacetylase (PgdA/CDA1 family) [Lapillicoccus jejuensis]|uniref:Peptidoglycan/xylan/chitin deacetylase (PgdA/CDA1 family) n=1 Tax=Lapillicoccus jejuensis TaxID=402171 RepID=A0A542E1E4_9MICO|nr:peptidoglycan/xylan/chitin deacetylase (PgdA/CDA1 family) [Lapillicoccus jejuensis]